VRLPTGARLWPPLALAFIAGSGLRAAAAPNASVVGDIAASAGYDTNLFLLVAAAPESPLYRPYRGPFARVAPAVTGGLAGDDLRLELRLGTDLRQTEGSGALFVEDLQLGVVRPEVGPFDLRLTAVGGRFDATVDTGLRFWSAGGVLQAVWRAAEGWRIAGTYRLARRWFGSPDRLGVTRDLTQEGELRLGCTPRPSVALGVAVSYVDLRSEATPSPTGPGMSMGAAAAVTEGPSGSQLQRPSVALDASVVLGGPVSGSGGLWLGALRTEGVVTDLQGGGSAAIWVRLAASLDVFARYDLLVDRRREAAAGQANFSRHVVGIGLAAHAATTRDVPTRTSTLAPQSQATTAAPLTGGGPGRSPASRLRIRFRLEATRAHVVAIVGSWNDWAANLPEQSLHPTDQEGPWETWLALPPGTHRYRFIVDGQPVRPPDAARYRRDDFGGEDGIVDVCPDGVSCEVGSSLPEQGPSGRPRK